MMRLCWSGLILGALLVGRVQAQSQLDSDEQTLKSSKLPTDTDGLIEFFRQRSLRDGDDKVLEDLVQKLGSDVYRTREGAGKQLILRGPAALPFLKTALKNTPLEMKRQAEACVRDIETTMQVEPISAAARVLAVRKAQAAASTLFNFLPSVSADPALEDQILVSVGRLTVQPGKVDPLIVQALKDPVPPRRAAAAYLLGRRGDMEHRATLRLMLGDPDPLVRQRVSQGLLGKRSGEVLAETAVADDTLLFAREQEIALKEKGVLDFFRKRTLNKESQEHMRALVKTLGADAHKLREQAYHQLAQVGSPALPFLKVVEFDTDVERSRRARDLMTSIREKTNTAVPIAAAHWLARQAANNKMAPAEAIRVLLDYIPFADDEMVEDEVLTSLTFLSLADTRIDAELRKALSDPTPARRGAAAYVLGHVGVKDDVVKVKSLLDDSHPGVRLRAAQGMVAARDTAALPCLAELLEIAPAPYLSRIEETLFRLAEEKGPSEVLVATSMDSRRKAARSWKIWLEANQAHVDLAGLGEREAFLGLCTVCEYDNRFGNIGGQIWESSRGNQKRWSFTGVTGAMDAHALPNGRVLVAENNSMRVTERDSKGAVKWEFQVPNNPICAQRLPNGNTFIASYNMVMEVKPNKQEVYRYTPGPQFYIFSAHKARNGHIVAITAQGQILEMDAKTGNTLHTVQTNTLGNWCSVELMPNGNYLVASMSTNSVREIDRKGGQEVWSKPFPGAFRATRLPTGNVLVASMTTREVAEMDRNGTIRWRATCAGRPWSVHYR